MNRPLVPPDFVVPEGFETKAFKLRMLTVNDLVKDYDAVMTSVDHLQGVFGKGSTWPTVELTLEQDLIDLGWHQKEFQKRSSFAYTVVSLDEKLCLGCMYIYPTSEDLCDAEVYLWARQSHLAGGLENELLKAVQEWIATDWPFKRVIYPGSNIPAALRIKVTA